MMIAAYSYRLDVFEGGSSSTGARFIDLKALLEVSRAPGNESISDRRRENHRLSSVPFKVWGMDSFPGINNGESLRDLGFKSPIYSPCMLLMVQKSQGQPPHHLGYMKTHRK